MAHARNEPSYFPPAITASAPSPLTASTPTLASSADGQLPLRLQPSVIIGGGTGTNSFVGAFQYSTRADYVLPVSDDGGSSSEIQRVLGGGPSLGDIRSRLVRLIPDAPPAAPLSAIRRLLEHRLSGYNGNEAKEEWVKVVEGKHPLWAGIPGDRKECIRAFLVHVNSAILKKAQRNFSFVKASIGNLLLAGAFLYLGGLPPAIFLFASITDIPHEVFRCVPVINTSSTATIAAELENGDVIAGQSNISHPSPAGAPPARSVTPAPSGLAFPPSPGPSTLSSAWPTRPTTPALFEARTLGDEEEEDDDSAVTEAERNRNVVFSKTAEVPLESRIHRIFYLNAYGTEIFPRANPLFIESLGTATTLVYSCGSLYTSIIPCLALRSVGLAIARSRSLRARVLLLNSKLDRETPGYTASDFVEAVRSACSGSYGAEGTAMPFEARELISHVVYIEGSEVQADSQRLHELGIVSVGVHSPSGMYDEQLVSAALRDIYASLE